MQHHNKHTCNICLENRWNIGNKSLQHTCTTIATYATSLIYFCNIRMKHLQRTSQTSETLESYACNMRFSPFFFRMTQRRAGDEQSDLLEVSEGAAGTGRRWAFGRAEGCCRRRREEREAKTGQQWAQAAVVVWPGEGREEGAGRKRRVRIYVTRNPDDHQGRSRIKNGTGLILLRLAVDLLARILFYVFKKIILFPRN
jgi:hypothetical protein